MSEQGGVLKINTLLQGLRIPIIVGHFSDCVPSLWIAILESLIETRIPDVIRSPTTSPTTDPSAASHETRMHNTQQVIKVLEKWVLKEPLSHIHAADLVRSDPTAVKNLIDIMWELGVAFGFVQSLESQSIDSVIDSQQEVLGTDDSFLAYSKNVPLPDEDTSVVLASELREGENTSVSFAGSGVQEENMTTAIQDSVPQSNADAPPIETLEEISPPLALVEMESLTSSKNSSLVSSQKNSSGDMTPGRASTNSGADEPLTSPMSPPVLRILPTDTPHMRALKLYRKTLIKKTNTSQSQTRSNKNDVSEEVPSLTKQLVHSRNLHKMIPKQKRSKLPTVKDTLEMFNPHGAMKKAASRSSKFQKHASQHGRKHTRSPDINESRNLQKENGRLAFDFDETQVLGPTSQLFQSSSDSRPEANLKAFRETVLNETGLQGNKNFYPMEGEASRVWDSQLKTWKRALDDRIWTQKVVLSKEMEKLDDSLALDYLIKDQAKTKLIAERKKREVSLRKAKTALAERNRQVKRIQHRQLQAQEEVERTLKRRKIKEEQVLQGLLDEFLDKQRQALIEERKAERETRGMRDQERAKAESSRRHFLEDQIKLLREQLAETQKEEEIVRKAKEEELRKLIREHKDIAKEHIQGAKAKLETDWENLTHFQTLAADELRQNIQFKARPRRK